MAGEVGGLDLVSGEGVGSPEGGVHGGAAQSEGNGGEGRRLVVDTRALVGAASMERAGGRRAARR
jgi:hypothetical protein